MQIEVWDRFDYANEHWENSPWNPKNNINYSYTQSGFAEEYASRQLYQDKHPFFHTIEGTRHYTNRYDSIRQHQDAFVDKMLSYSLPHGHVLYCMNNETSSEAGWGRYWISVSMGITTRTSAAGGYRLMKKTIKGGGVATLSAPYKGGWVAVLVKT